MKRLLCLVLTLVLLLPGCAAHKNDLIVATEDGCDFSLVYDTTNRELEALAQSIQQAFQQQVGLQLPVVDDMTDPSGNEIILDTLYRDACTQVFTQLQENQYAVVHRQDEATGYHQIVLTGTGAYQRQLAVKTFIEQYVKPKTVYIPLGENMVKTFDGSDYVIESSIPSLRDPFVLVEGNTYYMYGTGWVCYKNTTGKLDSGWESLGQVVVAPADYETNPWAPEVYRYQGAYYMFTTYFSSQTGVRGCTIFRSDSPEGPFVQITDGQITPADSYSIDGTFYVDKEGQPWMIYVDEWENNPDKVGTMVATRLSEDLTHFIGEPTVLFRANEPAWSRHTVTDGCFLYTTKDGELLMLWSNFDADGYCVAIAKSDNGKPDGTWSHQNQLYSKSMHGIYDGGHGMLFTALDGKMYLSIHSPNAAIGERGCMPVFVPVKEENNTLVWDY